MKEAKKDYLLVKIVIAVILGIVIGLLINKTSSTSESGGLSTQDVLINIVLSLIF